MRVIMDLKAGKGRYYIIDVNNISFSTDELAFVFGTPGGILYIFNISYHGTEAYNILSNEVFEKGILDLRGYSYRMFDSDTLEEIFDDKDKEEENE